MFCCFAPVTRHSFQAMCTVFSRKDFFRLFDGLLRISTRKTNAEPRCLTSLGSHDGVIWAAKHIQLVYVHLLVNPYTDLTKSLWGTKYFLWETNSVFWHTIIPFREPLEKQMISGMGTETLVTRRWSIQHSVVTFT